MAHHVTMTWCDMWHQFYSFYLFVVVVYLSHFHFNICVSSFIFFFFIIVHFKIILFLFSFYRKQTDTQAIPLINNIIIILCEYSRQLNVCSIESAAEQIESTKLCVYVCMCVCMSIWPSTFNDFWLLHSSLHILDAINRCHVHFGTLIHILNFFISTQFSRIHHNLILLTSITAQWKKTANFQSYN